MKNLRRILLTILISTNWLLVAAQDTGRLDSFLQLLEKHNKAMGCVKIEQKGKIYERCIGMANIEKNRSNDAHTLFRIGSVSKTFTAVIILKLMEEGKLSLDDKLSKWYPDIENANQITLEHLLRHRSGIYNYTDTSEYEQYYTRSATHEEMLNRIKRYGSIFQPGERMQYSNSNYLLLAYIAEKVSDKDYSRLVEDMIVKHCGLKNTRPGNIADTVLNGAISYRWITNWVADPLTDASVSTGGGSLVSTPSDLVRFMQCLMRGELISFENLQKMMTMQDNYGYGMMKFPFYEKVVYGHTGGIDAYRSFAGFLPADSMYIALCSNGLAVSLNDILIGIMSIWYDMPYTFPDFTSLTVGLSILQRYEGIYVSPHLPLEIKIWVKDGQLMAQATGQSEFPLEAASETEFKFTPADVHMIFSSDGQGFTLRQRGMEFAYKRK